MSKLLDLIAALEKLEALSPQAVAHALGITLQAQEETNPHWKVFGGSREEPPITVELWVPGPTANTLQGRLMLDVLEAGLRRENVAERYGPGQIGEINPRIPPEGLVAAEYRTDAQTTIYRFTAKSDKLVDVVIDRQRPKE